MGKFLWLMAASGFASLGYQIVWTQQSALWLGHESAAVLAVVAAFFGGLSLGAWALGGRIARSPRPGRWYAACEAVIGVWSLGLTVLMAPVSGWLLGLTGAQPSADWQWSVAFAGTFLLLLPATAAMGATLPAMERVTNALRRQGSSIAALYAANTLGAVLGVLAAAFWLVPTWGLLRTAEVCVGLNLLCAVAAWRLFPVDVAGAAAARGGDGSPTTAGPGSGRYLARLALTGLLGIGYEVLVVRVLSQVAENTVYTFALLLAVYLVGSALGAAAYQRWGAGTRDGDALRDRLLTALAGACMLGAVSLWGAEVVQASVVDALGGGMAAALAAEASLALVAFLLPTIVMGALFSHLCTQACASGMGLGRALGVNTMGAALAPFVFGVVLLPAAGPKAALLMVAVGYLALISWRGWLAWRRPVAWSGGAAALALIALLAWAPPLMFVQVPEGGRLLSYSEGPTAAVSVVRDASGVSRLRIDNRQQEGSSASGLADGRQALLPLMLHPAPRRALFLGLGTGVTALTATLDQRLQVDAVELLPEVIEASEYFTRPLGGGEPNPRLHLMEADARRFVRAADQRYDVIVSDNFHPARSGSGALYTVEHFQAVRARLAPGGVFCQWLPLHQLDLDTLRSIVRSFMTVYPQGGAMLATNSLETPVLGLVARQDDGPHAVAAVRQRLADTAWVRSPGEFGLDDELSVLGSFVAGPGALARFAGDAALNTDDHPVVAYRAPRITYAPNIPPRDRLLALLRELSLKPAELVDASAGTSYGQALAAYWAARDRFLVVGRDVVPASDVRQMLAQVQEPLLSVLAISPAFRPAYDPLLRMAMVLARTDAVAARALLASLARVQPQRPEAALALRALTEH